MVTRKKRATKRLNKTASKKSSIEYRVADIYGRHVRDIKDWDTDTAVEDMRNLEAITNITLDSRVSRSILQDESSNTVKQTVQTAELILSNITLALISDHIYIRELAGYLVKKTKRGSKTFLKRLERYTYQNTSDWARFSKHIVQKKQGNMWDILPTGLDKRLTKGEFIKLIKKHGGKMQSYDLAREEEDEDNGPGCYMELSDDTPATRGEWDPSIIEIVYYPKTNRIYWE